MVRKIKETVAYINAVESDGTHVMSIVQPPLKDFALYKALKDSGYPQGGHGHYLQDPKTDEKVYVPQPSEIYALFIANAEGWQDMVDAMARVWLENKPR